MKPQTALLLLVLAATGCKQKTPGGTSATASAVGSAASSAPSRKPAWFTGHWSGAYASVKQYMDPMVGPEIAWQKDDGGTAHGFGKLSLDIDGNRHVTGTASGPLGDMTVRGTLDGTTLRLRLLPVQQHVGAFRGMLVAQRTGKTDGFEGTLHASGGMSRIVRDAPVKIRKGNTAPKVEMPTPKPPEGGVDIASQASPHAKRRTRPHAGPRAKTK